MNSKFKDLKFKITFQFLYYTNCINLSIRFVYPSVWRKKIRSSKENLNFNVRNPGRKSKHTCFSKASAKVLLFFELTKYFCKKMQEKMHFLCKCLIISTLNFWLFLDIFGQIGHFGAFWVKRASYVRELKYIRNARTRAKRIFAVISALPRAGSLRNSVRTFVLTAIFLASKILLKRA
jgi:hypothetical protein